MIRSPSQCPGTARSSASAGRSTDHDSSGDAGRRAALVGQARGRRSARPVRRQRVSSRRSCPGPGRRAPGRSSRGTPASPGGRGSHRAVSAAIWSGLQRARAAPGPGRAAAGCPRAWSASGAGPAPRPWPGPRRAIPQPLVLGRSAPAVRCPARARPARAARPGAGGRRRVAAGAWLRVSSRPIVDRWRPSRRAISAWLCPAAQPSAISSRSANDRYRPDGSQDHGSCRQTR